MNEQKLTYGEKAVGLTFNPSGDAKVTKLKQLFAEVIDLVDGQSYVGFGADIADQAIVEAMAAQMWAVKAVTWGN